MSQTEEREGPQNCDQARDPAASLEAQGSGKLSHLAIEIELASPDEFRRQINVLSKIVEEIGNQTVPELSFFFVSSNLKSASESDILGEEIAQTFTKIRQKYKNTDLKLLSHFDASSKQRILDEIRHAAEVGWSEITAKDLDMACGAEFSTAPDLILFIGPNVSLGNANLWHGAYSEFHFFEKPWEAFDIADLRGITAMFGDRERRFGGV